MEQAERAVREQQLVEVGLTGEQQQHIRTCRWCQRALAIAQRLVEESEQQVAPWPVVVGERLRAWLAQQESSSTLLPTAEIDEAGRLHIDWQGLREEGLVEISLLWQGLRLHLGRGEVRGGRLRWEGALKQLGLRRVGLPAAFFVLEPVREKQKR